MNDRKIDHGSKIPLDARGPWNSLRAARRAGKTATSHNRMMEEVLATYPHVDDHHLRYMYPQRLSLFSGRSH